MQALIASLVLTFYTVWAGDVPTFYPQFAVYKSFPSALAECAQFYEVSNCSLDRIVKDSFPNEREVKKLVRCVFVNLRCWNDAAGVQEHVIHSFFNPTPEDSNFLDRTRECIKKSQLQLESSSDVETQAYNAFICYYRQYGNMNNTNQFLPLLPQELDQLVLASLSLASVSNEALVEFSLGNMLDNSEFIDVLAIIFIRGGFSHHNSMLNHLYIQFANPEILSPKTEQCVEATFNTLPCYTSEKEQLYRVFRNCFQEITDILSLVHRLSNKLLGSDSTCSSGSSTKAPSKTYSQAPFYNVAPRRGSLPQVAGDLPKDIQLAFNWRTLMQ